ncbi:hypothetical protein Raf01_00140 [Rugosimonospora africana]|uniref:TPR repeat protein n=2 Tax=Rugosimonospora africana TaxID=556532 RepID=A0A8J3QLL7_9ACTN|nr:hypothetical protein Raf01_00140 [Rugosimonospora africana]
MAGFRVVSGAAPTVATLTENDLGVKPALKASDAEPALVPYISRDRDSQLQEAVDNGGFILIFGPSTAGKTRTAFQALKTLPANRLVLIPERPEALRELAETSDLSGPYVVWLDDIERFLGPGGLDRAALDRIYDRQRSDVLILATVRSDELMELEAPTATRDSEGSRPVMRAGVDVLAQTSLRVELRAKLSPAEKMNARDHLTDSRVAAALAHPEYGLGEYLAAGPQMLLRWHAAGNYELSPASAIISAAADFRRAGFGKPIPAGELAEAHVCYLAERIRHSPALKPFPECLRWVCEPVAGASSCLSAIRDESYAVSDYLFERAVAGDGPRGKEPIPDQIWDQVLRLSADGDVFSIGLAARAQQRPDVTEIAFRRGAAATEPQSMNGLGVILLEAKNPIEAEQWFLRAVDAGMPEAKHNLANLYWEKGDRDAAESLYLELADSHEFAPSMVNLGNLASPDGDPDKREYWYRRAAEANFPPAMHNLAILLDNEGEFEESGRWFRKAYSEGQLISLVALAESLARRGETEEAKSAFHEAYRAGSLDAAWALGTMCQRHEEFEEAESAYRIAALEGHLAAIVSLGLLLAQLGRSDEAEKWLSRGAAAGSASAMNTLGILRAREGSTAEADEWYRRSAKAGMPASLTNRAALFRAADDEDAAGRWFSPYFEPDDDAPHRPD